MKVLMFSSIGTIISEISRGNFMCFKIIGDATALTHAIDAFSSKYHEDYFEVRAQAAAYFAEAPTLSSAQRLAGPLLAALRSWGGRKTRGTLMQVD
jgi:hypothetical protein